MKQYNIFGEIDEIEYDKENDNYKTIKTMNEWNILIGLFKATVEQQNMLTGQTKQEAKMVFNQWVNQGQKLIKLIENLSNEEELDRVTEKIEDSLHELRK